MLFYSVVFVFRRKFAGMLYKLDESVGIVVEKLKEIISTLKKYSSFKDDIDIINCFFLSLMIY